MSPGLEQVILGCLQKNPEKRYQTASDLRQDLLRLVEGKRTSAAQQQQGRRFAAAALAVVLAISAAAVYHFWPEIRRPSGPSARTQASQFRLMAILPVETAGQGPSDNALVRGMAETVSAHIARATLGQQLQLIPPSELIARGANTTDAVRREFGVERVLEVAVQRSGNKVRVTCSLIDSKTHQVLNACTVTGDDADLFALQDTLAGEVTAMLPPGSQNGQAEPEVVQAAAPAGYEFYLKGRGYLLDYQKPENIDAAIQEFQQALKISPNYAPAYAGLGEAYWRGYEGDRGKSWLDQASSNCRKALSADSRLAEAHTCLGNIYNDTGQYEKAVDEFNRALGLDKSVAQTFNGLGKAYTHLGNTAAAEQTYKQAIASWPQYWAVYNWLGQFYVAQARYSDAVPMFQKVNQLRPDNYRGYANLGGTLLLEGKYDEAIEALNRSIALRPDLFAYSNLGTAYFYRHRYADAVAAYEKARGLDDHLYISWGNLGDALYWLPGRRPDATAAYKQATALAQVQVQVNPRDATARAYLADYSAMVGDKSTAAVQIRKALELAPTDPDVMFRAALVYNQFGDRQQTLDWLKKAAEARFSVSTIRDTPDFDPLHSDPRFITLVAGN